MNVRRGAFNRTNALRRKGFTLLEMLIVVTIMAVVASVVIVRLPDFATSDAQLAARVQRHFEIAAQHAALAARPVQLHASTQALVFSEFRNGQWRALPDGAVALDRAQRLVMVNMANQRLVDDAQRLRVDELGRWPALRVELYRGGQSVRAFRVGG